MVRNAFKSDFRSSKMAAGSHFVNKIKNKKVVYWSEMARNAIGSDLWSSKMAPGSHFVKKKKSCVLIWNGEKCDRNWFSVIQNGHRQPFCGKKRSCILIWNGEKCDRKWFSVIQNGRQQPFCEQNQKNLKVAYWSEMARNGSPPPPPPDNRGLFENQILCYSENITILPLNWYLHVYLRTQIAWNWVLYVDMCTVNGVNLIWQIFTRLGVIISSEPHLISHLR